jgi:hypothetical protein
LFKEQISFNTGRARSKTTKLLLLDSLLHTRGGDLVFQIETPGPRLKKHGGIVSEMERS